MTVQKLQPGDATADDLFRLHGIALRYEGESGKWVAAFHFAGPDVVVSGPSIEEALHRFTTQVRVMQEPEKFKIIQDE